MSHTVLLYYKYVTLSDPEAEMAAQRELCTRLGLKGRILLASEGINGTVAGSSDAAAAYIAYMNAHPLFSDIQYKQDVTPSQPFPRLRVKVRPEVVTLGVDVDSADTAPRLTPAEFNEMIKDPDVVLFDARNNYESAIGRFKNAVTPDIPLFKDLPAALDQYEALKDKTVVTYCTGGIRCEKASALMKRRGFKNIYQLDGGIINYAQAFPDGAFEGECFVFDDRLSVAFIDNPARLGSCIHCGGATNSYRNCALPRCNDLVLVCDDCIARPDLKFHTPACLEKSTVGYV
ncbi:MAG: rhodanese-related sulfurtransferase [Candidatus Saccharimonadales bacterium]